MTQTQQELERLRTLQESYHDLDDKINVVLPALADKIDNIQLPEINTDTLAKQGDDPEATNTAIMLSLDTIKELIGEVVLIPNNDDVGEGNQAWTLVLNKTMSVNNGVIE